MAHRRRTATVLLLLTTLVALVAVTGNGAAIGIEEPVHGRSLLREGDRGADVAQWQETLNEWIARTESDTPSRLRVDAVFGPLTDSATRAFQRAHGVVVDGIVGPQTLAATAHPEVLNPSPSALLARGARGPAVVAWQAALNAWLDTAGEPDTHLVVDGVFGLRTEAVTRHFQAAMDVAIDGRVGPETRQAMDAISARQGDGEPAGGICFEARGPVARIELMADVADPRCISASADQGLEITNSTPSTATVTLGPAHAEVPSGETRRLITALGGVLGSGVHTVHVSTYGGSGPQVWIR